MTDNFTNQFLSWLDGGADRAAFMVAISGLEQGDGRMVANDDLEALLNVAMH